MSDRSMRSNHHGHKIFPDVDEHQHTLNLHSDDVAVSRTTVQTRIPSRCHFTIPGCNLGPKWLSAEEDETGRDEAFPNKG